MFGTIWHTFFFDPVYNGLVFFIDIFPHGDVGLSIIATVVVVKLVLLPLSIKAVKTQKLMREIQPKLEEVKKKHKDDKQAQAQAMMEIYKEAGMNPFSSILVAFLQIPIVIALYLAVSRGGGIPLPEINVDLLYTFIPVPGAVSMEFLGMFDISARSILLAALAGALQFIHVRMMLPEIKPRDPNAAPNFKDDFARNMQLQMKYMMPLLIFFVAYTVSAAIALYFVVSTLTAIAQEVYVKRHR